MLTPEQETAAEKIQQNYSSHLRSLNRDVEGLHNRLVSLEADKLVELGKIADEDATGGVPRRKSSDDERCSKGHSNRQIAENYCWL